MLKLAIRRSSPLLAAAALLLSSSQVLAFAPRGPGSVPSSAQDRLHFVDGTPADARDVTWSFAPTGRAGRAWARFQAEVGWARASWDRRSEVPSRILLGGVPVRGSVESEGVASRWSREFLARHLELLAPGARLDDLVIVADELDAGIRSVGFAQRSGGLPVHGGQIGLRFKHDRLIAISSEAIPNVVVPSGHAALSLAEIERAAVDHVAAIAPGSLRAAQVLPGPLLLRRWTSTGGSDLRVVEVTVELEGPTTRWQVFVDAEQGHAVASRQTLMFASAGTALSVPVRYPEAGYAGYPASHADFTIDGAPQTLDALGQFTFAGPSAAVTAVATGPFFALADEQGTLPSLVANVGDGEVLAWTGAPQEFDDAHLASFVHAGRVRAHVLGIAPELSFLQEQVPVTVNIANTCNAYSDGFSINFFMQGDGCANTGRLADVVYHEYGHSVHTQALIPGVGYFDGAMSEGASDYLSATITGDAGVGRGFFFDDQPLRDIDPPDYEWSWPQDKGEVHSEGHIIAGAMWDLRQLLIAKHGDVAGRQRADHIWYQTLRRGGDIFSGYPEALVANDDDGDLSNGTPDVCEIIDAYGRHGLYVASIAGEPVVDLDDTGLGYVVTLELAQDYPQCDLVAEPVLNWKVRGAPGEPASLPLSGQAGSYSALIPTHPDGTVLQYRISIWYPFDGTERLPRNYVDPFYEYYVGPVVELYCTSFESGIPGDWTLDDPSAWQTGAPGAFPSSLDPAGAFDGEAVLGNDVTGPDGLYSPDSTTMVTTPAIDASGFESVRLQYRRWLTLEDGYWDQARILGNGVPLWATYASDEETVATLHHVDDEWRFHDVELEPSAAGTVEVSFALDSDGGKEFGGWNIDSLCIVGAGEAPPEEPWCGNGIVEDGEACDDGNDIAGDGCEPDCTLSAEEPPETDDTGGSDTGETDTSFGPGGDYNLVGRGCGCAADGGSRGGAGLLALFAWIGLARRRRPRG